MMNRTQLISLFFILLLAFIVWQVLYILSPLAGPMFWAAILAFAFYPLHKKIKSTLKVRDAIASLSTTALMILLLLPPAIMLVLNLASEAVNFYHWMGDVVRERRFESLLTSLKNYPPTAKLYNALSHNQFFRENIEIWISEFFQSFGDLAAAKAKRLIQVMILTPINLILIVFLVFFFLKDGKRICGFIKEAAPLDDDVKETLFLQLQETFAAVIRGQFVTAFAQACVAAIVYLIVGTPLPIFFAALTFVASLIPVFGSALIWGPLAFYLATIGALNKALLLLVLGTFGISLVDNFLKPILIGEKTKLPYLALFLGIMGGMKMYGLFGIFLAPTILSLFFVLIKIYRERVLKS